MVVQTLILTTTLGEQFAVIVITITAIAFLGVLKGNDL